MLTTGQRPGARGFPPALLLLLLSYSSPRLIQVQHVDHILESLSGSLKSQVWDFPGGTVVKNPPANAGDMG